LHADAVAGFHRAGHDHAAEAAEAGVGAVHPLHGQAERPTLLSQGIDFHRPQTTSPRLQRLHGALRERVDFYDADRYLAPDIEAATALIHGELPVDLCLEVVDDLLPSYVRHDASPDPE